MNKTIEEFTKTFCNDTGQSGKLIQEMLDESSRLFVNIPFLGTARKISSRLRESTFSDFYTFERTLSHKLHPTLFKRNLNLLSAITIDKVFNKKYSAYKAELPEKPLSEKGTSSADVLSKLTSLKSMILKMHSKEGPFMVIRFCDNILSRIAPDLSRMLRSVEFTINLTRRQFSDDNDFNYRIFKNRYSDFEKRFGSDFTRLFIERTSWDENLKKYADMLTRENSRTPEKTRSARSQNMIREYAHKVKVGYLDKTADDNEKRIRKIVESVHQNNSSKFGETTGDEIIKDIISCWLDDEEISEAKRILIKKVRDELFPETQVQEETAEEDALPEIDFPEEEGDKDDQNENFFEITDEETGEEGGFDIADDETEKEGNFDIADEEAGMEGGFNIADKEAGEEENFHIADKDKDESGSFAISGEGRQEENSPGSGEEADSGTEISPEQPENPDESSEEETISPDRQEEEELLQMLAEKASQLHEIDSQLEKAAELAEKEVRKLAEIEDSAVLSARATKMMNSEIYEDYRFQILDILKERETENLFIRIIHYLETQKFPSLNTSEKAAVIDLFIEQYRDNLKLVQQLENYKKSMKNYRSLLENIYATLTKIEKSYPGIKKCSSIQLRYLEKFLQDNEYQPVWKTIRIIYDNIVNQMKDETPARIREEISEITPVRQIELLSYLRDFYRDNRELKKEITSLLKSEKFASLNERINDEKKGNAPDIKKLFTEIMQEESTPRHWIEQIVNSPAQDTDASGDNEALQETRDETARPEEAEILTENTDQEQESEPAGESAGSSLQEFISTADLSTDESYEKLSGKIEELISDSAEKAAESLEDIISKSGLDPVIREAILEQYRESGIPMLEKLYMAHRMAEESFGQEGPSHEDDEIEKILTESGVPSAAVASFKAARKQRQADNIQPDALSGIISSLDDKDADRQEEFLNAAAEDPSLPDEIRESAARISGSLKSGRFDDVLFSITSAGDPPEMKAAFLGALKVISVKRGWIKEDLSDEISQERAEKLDERKAFYEKLAQNRAEENTLFSENMREYRETFSGKEDKSRFSKIKADVKSKKKKKKSEEAPDLDSMSKEEQVFHYSDVIIKAFSDNITALEPVIGILAGANSSEQKESLMNKFNLQKKEIEFLVSGTNRILKTGNSDPDLISRLHRAQPKQQFLWGRELMRIHKKEKLEDIFSAVSKNREAFDSLIRISKIISTNNANNFLSQSIEKDIRLVKTISSNLTEEKLKKLKLKTKSRQDKEKIGLFRDLLGVTGDLAGAETARKEQQPLSAEEPGPGEEKIKKEFEAAMQHEDESTENTKARQIRYIKEISREVDAFINLYKSERTRKMALNNSERIAAVNGFLGELAAGSEDACAYTEKHREDCIRLFSLIIRQKLSGIFTSAGPALKYTLAKGIIERSEL